MAAKQKKTEDALKVVLTRGNQKIEVNSVYERENLLLQGWKIESDSSVQAEEKPATSPARSNPKAS